MTRIGCIKIIVGLALLSSFLINAAESKEYKLKVLHWNIATYGDYLGLRDIDGINKNIKQDCFYKERNSLLKVYFKRIAEMDPDIITFQEIYGANPEVEKTGIRKLLKILKGYQLIEDKSSPPIRSGDAIIFYKKSRFINIGELSLLKSSIVHLEDMKNNRRKVCVVSSHLPGFDITGPDRESMSGDGKRNLTEILDILSDEQFDNSIKIIGTDANCPPEGMIHKKATTDTTFTIISGRITLLKEYQTGCNLDPQYELPSPTAINNNVEGGVRLDYVWAKAPKEYTLTITEDPKAQACLAPYKLSKDSSPLRTNKFSKSSLPVSDHLPLICNIIIR